MDKTLLQQSPLSQPVSERRRWRKPVLDTLPADETAVGGAVEIDGPGLFS